MPVNRGGDTTGKVKLVATPKGPPKGSLQGALASVGKTISHAVTTETPKPTPANPRPAAKVVIRPLPQRKATPIAKQDSSAGDVARRIFASVTLATHPKPAAAVAARGELVKQGDSGTSVAGPTSLREGGKTVRFPDPAHQRAHEERVQEAKIGRINKEAALSAPSGDQGFQGPQLSEAKPAIRARAAAVAQSKETAAQRKKDDRSIAEVGTFERKNPTTPLEKEAVKRAAAAKKTIRLRATPRTKAALDMLPRIGRADIAEQDVRAMGRQHSRSISKEQADQVDAASASLRAADALKKKRSKLTVGNVVGNTFRSGKDAITNIAPTIQVLAKAGKEAIHAEAAGASGHKAATPTLDAVKKGVVENDPIIQTIKHGPKAGLAASVRDPLAAVGEVAPLLRGGKVALDVARTGSLAKAREAEAAARVRATRRVEDFRPPPVKGKAARARLKADTGLSGRRHFVTHPDGTTTEKPGAARVAARAVGPKRQYHRSVAIRTAQKASDNVRASVGRDPVRPTGRAAARLERNQLKKLKSTAANVQRHDEEAARSGFGHGGPVHEEHRWNLLRRGESELQRLERVATPHGHALAREMAGHLTDRPGFRGNSRIGALETELQDGALHASQYAHHADQLARGGEKSQRRIHQEATRYADEQVANAQHTVEALKAGEASAKALRKAHAAQKETGGKVDAAMRHVDELGPDHADYPAAVKAAHAAVREHEKTSAARTLTRKQHQWFLDARDLADERVKLSAHISGEAEHLHGLDPEAAVIRRKMQVGVAHGRIRRDASGNWVDPVTGREVSLDEIKTFPEGRAYLDYGRKTTNGQPILGRPGPGTGFTGIGVHGTGMKLGDMHARQIAKLGLAREARDYLRRSFGGEHGAVSASDGAKLVEKLKERSGQDWELVPAGNVVRGEVRHLGEELKAGPLKPGEQGYVALPAPVAKYWHQEMKPISRSLHGARMVNRAFYRGVLGLNPAWLAGNAADSALRLGMAGARGRHWDLREQMDYASGLKQLEDPGVHALGNPNRLPPWVPGKGGAAARPMAVGDHHFDEAYRAHDVAERVAERQAAADKAAAMAKDESNPARKAWLESQAAAARRGAQRIEHSGPLGVADDGHDPWGGMDTVPHEGAPKYEQQNEHDLIGEDRSGPAGPTEADVAGTHASSDDAKLREEAAHYQLQQSDSPYTRKTTELWRNHGRSWFEARRALQGRPGHVGSTGGTGATRDIRDIINSGILENGMRRGGIRTTIGERLHELSKPITESWANNAYQTLVDKSLDASAKLENHWIRGAEGLAAERLAKEIGLDPKVMLSNIDEAAKLTTHLLTHPEAEQRFHDLVTNVIGDYVNRTPTSMRWQAAAVPFLPWLKAAAKWTFRTLPADNPNKVALYLLAARATEQDRRTLGMSDWITRSEARSMHLPDPVNGFIGGGLTVAPGWVVPAQTLFSPGEVARQIEDPLGHFGRHVFPQVSGIAGKALGHAGSEVGYEAKRLTDAFGITDHAARKIAGGPFPAAMRTVLTYAPGLARLLGATGVTKSVQGGLGPSQTGSYDASGKLHTGRPKSLIGDAIGLGAQSITTAPPNTPVDGKLPYEGAAHPTPAKLRPGQKPQKSPVTGPLSKGLVFNTVTKGFEPGTVTRPQQIAASGLSPEAQSTAAAKSIGLKPLALGPARAASEAAASPSAAPKAPTGPILHQRAAVAGAAPHGGPTAPLAPRPIPAPVQSLQQQAHAVAHMPPGAARDKAATALMSAIQRHVRYLKANPEPVHVISAPASAKGAPDPSSFASTSDVFTPHGGEHGFFPSSGTDYSSGSEQALASRLDKLGKDLGLRLTGLSGHRTPEHSVAVGGFPNDPHTKGQASDTPGVEGVPEATLNKYGLTRPFGGAKEADHIQLLGGSAGTAAAVPAGPAVHGSSDPNQGPDAWARHILKAGKFPLTPANVQAMSAWARAEGGHFKNDSKFNPLNTTQPEPGAGNTGTQGNIKVYGSWRQGDKATLTTLNNGKYGAIVAALKKGKDATEIAQAIGASPWGTTAAGIMGALGATGGGGGAAPMTTFSGASGVGSTTSGGGSSDISASLVDPTLSPDERSAQLSQLIATLSGGSYDPATGTVTMPRKRSSASTTVAPSNMDPVSRETKQARARIRRGR